MCVCECVYVCESAAQLHQRSAPTASGRVITGPPGYWNSAGLWFYVFWNAFSADRILHLYYLLFLQKKMEHKKMAINCTVSQNIYSTFFNSFEWICVCRVN